MVPTRHAGAALVSLLLGVAAVLAGSPGAASAAPSAAPSAPAPRSTAGPCPSTTDGVTVVVDFAATGGGVQVRCARGQMESGLDALKAAGFSYEFVTRVPGMVCQINGRPDPCNGAPANAYWSYWHAPRGGGWSYSGHGAGSRRPPAGSVEGWAFGAGAPPGSPPPAPPATTTTRPPATTQPPATTAPAAPPPTTPPAGGGGAPTPGPAPAPAPGGGPEAESGDRPGHPDRSADRSDQAGDGREEPSDSTAANDVTGRDRERGRAASGDDRRPDPAGPDGARDDRDDRDHQAAQAELDPSPTPASSAGGSPGGLIAGLALVAGIGALAGIQARRRRSATGPS